MHQENTKQMLALQVQKYKGSLKWEKVQMPVPKDHQVLAKTLCSGICHTDLHVIAGEFSESPSILPITPGHEGIGKVVAIGSKVTKIRIGDRVGAPWLGEACMTCYVCKLERYNLCENQKNTGFTLPGSFAEYFVADERFVGKLPKNLKSEIAAPIICAGLTVYSALKRAQLPSGARVVISGACGGLGHLAIQYAKILNLEVVALDDLSEERKSLVKSLGAQFAVNICAQAEKLASQLQHLDDTEKPIEAAIILAPCLSAVSDAVEYVSPGGTIICIGLPKGAYSIPCAKFVLKGLKMIGSIVGTPQELDEALELAANGSIVPHMTLKKKNDIPSILDDLEQGKIAGRIVVEFDDNP